ncbi:MAG: alkaline protease, partial [Muribaculaceae bacterium]|nr:alkaline protease [Muribaculaceae bacterium]
MTLKKLILLSTAVAASMAVQAQTVSLDSCRNMAVRNNKAIKMAEEGVIGARYEKKAAFSAYLPGIDFT